MFPSHDHVGKNNVDYDGAGFSGSSTTTAQIDFNFIKNAQFSFPWFKLQYNLKYDGTATLPIQVGSWVGAEWGFAKNNTSATDTIEYVEFASGQTSVPYNPIHYLEWTLGAQGSSETFKVISQRLDNTDNIFTPNIFGGQNSVQQFSGQTIAFSIWAKSTTGTTLTCNIRQYFGSGGSADVVTVLLNQTLTSTWTQYTAIVAIPSIAGKTIGLTSPFCQFEIDLPLNTDATLGANIAICNVQIQLANEIFPFQYKSFGQQISEFGPWFKFPSGQFQFMSDSTEGWLLLSDTLTIGNANSSASYAIEHNFAVYRAIYDNFSNTYAPVNTGRGASALADFAAGS